MPDRRKLENAALVVPVFGAVLMVPPLISVFDVPVTIFGAPLETVYLFAVWVALIGITALLSRRMKDTSLEDPQGSDSGEKSGDES